MWVIAKIKLRNLNIFKKSLSEKIGKDLKFYNPKIEYHKYYGSKVKKFEKFKKFPATKTLFSLVNTLYSTI